MNARIFTDPENPDPVELELLLHETEPNPGEPKPILDRYRDPDELAERTWADGAWITLCLSTTPETWQALREGGIVADSALDPHYLRLFRATGAIQ